MPICIECSQPVPQLYHVLSSKKKTAQSSVPDESRGKAHRRNPSGGASGGGSSGGAGAGGSWSQHQGGSASSGNITAHSSTGQTGSNSGGSNVTNNSGGGGGFKGGGEAKKSSAGAAPDVRLTQCPRCKRFADKYVEHDLVVLFIDLVLVKPQVYRHLLFNRLAPAATTTAKGSATKGGDKDGAGGLDSFDPAIQRLGVLLVLFDVYLTWSAIETSSSPLMQSSSVPRLPILAQYIFYLVLCSLTAVTQHLVIRELSQLRWFRGPDIPVMEPATGLGSTKGSSTATNTGGGIGYHFSNSTGISTSSNVTNTNNSSPQKRRQNVQSPSTTTTAPTLPSRPPSSASTSQSPVTTNPPFPIFPIPDQKQITMHPPPAPHKNAVSTALFVSSCMRLFPILMVVWKYEDSSGQLATGVSWAVALQNVEALRILLSCGYGAAGVLVGAGWAASALVGRALLASVGLRALGWGG